MPPIQTLQSTVKEVAHLQALCEIMTDRPSSFEEQLSRALKEGLTMLGLDLGIVSNITGNKYIIFFFAPHTAQLAEGQVFDLSTTYCALTIENQDVIAIDHMADSPNSGHPCYSTFSLESYIGVPILVDGLPYGTLNFSSSSPRAVLFTEADKNFVRLMGRWIGSRLSRRFQAQELKKYRTRLEDLVKKRTIELQNTNKSLKKEIKENKKSQNVLLKQRLFLNTSTFRVDLSS
jgi:GAF domain-containing protein